MQIKVAISRKNSIFFNVKFHSKFFCNIREFENTAHSTKDSLCREFKLSKTSLYVENKSLYFFKKKLLLKDR